MESEPKDLGGLSGLHHQAINCADISDFAGRLGEAELARDALLRALDMECRAISALNGEAPQPTHAVLHRSAATIALRCGYRGMAVALVEVALSRNPPASIERELIKVKKEAEK